MTERIGVASLPRRIYFSLFSLQPMDSPCENVEKMDLTKVFLRPAFIEIRFRDDDKYKQAVDLYAKVLGLAGDANATDTAHTFPVAEQVLLRLANGASANDTIVYWQVPSGADLSGIYHELIKSAEFTIMTPEEPPKDDDPIAGRETPKRAVLKDPAGNRVGLIINPPVPFMNPAVELPQMEFPIEPTHVVNPPVTVDGGSSGGS